MRLPLTVSVFAVLASTCSSTPAVIPTRNLEHPSDMTFVCVKEVPDSNGTLVLSGQPMDPSCHGRDVVDPTVILSGQRNLGTFTFVANPARNEVAVADMDRSRLIDLTPAAPGYGLLEVGGTPEAIASTLDGCWVATANRTSCDFTLIDPARVLAPTFSTSSSSALPASGTGDASRQIAVKTASGRELYAAIGEIAFLPPQAIPDPNLCSTGATPRAVVTFPGCDMVALLDFSFEAQSATIASAYYIRPDLPGGFLAAGTDPVCPDDCAPSADAAGLDAGSEAADGGTGVDASIDGGSAAGSTSWHLQPLALVPDGTRVYVGSLLDTAITSLDIGSAGLANPTRFNLAENPVGVTRLRLGVDPYRAATAANADGTTGGQFLRNRGKFLYAFTRDDSIRVVNLDQATPVECDANIVVTDPSVTDPAKGCFPVGSTPRRALAQGPGIHIPTFSNPDSPAPLPRDISFADLQPTALDGNYQSLSGQFGFVVADNGQVYVLNLAPKGEDTPDTLGDGEQVFAAATHSFRDARDIGKYARTPLALSIAPQRQVIVSDQAFPTTATYSAQDGPLIRSFSPDNGITTDWLDYPDLDTLISRSWTVIWEGALPYTTRSSGIVQSAPDSLSAGVLLDSGASFCSSGAQTGDVLMFSGCTQNSDCQPDDQLTCQVAVSGARGMCLPISASDSAKLIDRCNRFMGSRMRYEIAQSAQTSLRLQLKLDEVPKTKLNPCTKETQETDCSFDVDHGKGANSPPDGGIIHAFECVQVRPPEQEPPRCVKRCSLGVDSDCRAGYVCEAVPWTLPGAAPRGTGFCVEAPPIDPTCFPQPTMTSYSPRSMISYSVRAGHSFMVYGSSMPTISSVQAAADGTCQPQAPSNPSRVARIPLSAPKCPDSLFNSLSDPASSAKFVQQLSAQPGSNPCLYQGSRPDGDTSVSLEAGAPDDHIRAFFQNPQIRFVLTNLEQYAGDLLAIHFELQYGYVPLTVQIPSYEVLLTLGTRIVTGPLQTPESPIKQNTTQAFSYPYLYVVDQGRTALTPGSRGQVLRINPRAGSNEIASFDTTLSGSTPFQLQ
jgi:hypothetical protein